MSDALNHALPAAAMATAPPPGLTHYEEIAAQVGAAIAAALAPLGPLEAPHPATRGFMRAHANIDVSVIAAVVSAVESAPELQGTNFDVDEARDTVKSYEALLPTLKQCLVQMRNAIFTIEARKAKVAEKAMHVYALAKRYARDPKSAALAQVGIIRSLLDSFRAKKQKPQVQPAAVGPGKEVPLKPA